METKEMRLIDISKFPLLPNRLEGVISEYERGYLDAQANMNALPTVDAVEVVRCKNCESYDASGCYEGFGWCFLHEKGKMDNDYCSCGAKMDGDGNDQ